MLSYILLLGTLSTLGLSIDPRLLRRNSKLDPDYIDPKLLALFPHLKSPDPSPEPALAPNLPRDGKFLLSSNPLFGSNSPLGSLGSSSLFGPNSLLGSNPLFGSRSLLGSSSLPKDTNVGEFSLGQNRLMYTYVNSTGLTTAAVVAVLGFGLVAGGLYLYDLVVLGGDGYNTREDTLASTEDDFYGYNGFDASRIKRRYVFLPMYNSYCTYLHLTMYSKDPMHGHHYIAGFALLVIECIHQGHYILGRYGNLNTPPGRRNNYIVCSGPVPIIRRSADK